MTMTSNIRCSFCAVTGRELFVRAAPGKLIAGPADVYICSDCVGLCAEVLIEERAGGSLTAIGEHVDIIATLTSERDALTSERDAAVARARRLELGMEVIAKSVVQAMPELRGLRCMWCNVQLADDAAAREHVATCAKHPAVIELRALEAKRRARPRKGSEP